MGFSLGCLGRIVIFGSAGPVLAIGGTVAGLACYGVYRLAKDQAEKRRGV